VQKNAIILAHNYQLPEVQDIADFVGDSLGLSQMAAQTSAAVIVFCGVHFMAETAKLLSPEKKVILPYANAGCPMADMIREEDVLDLRKKYPQAKVVCYVNTSAAVKAHCDVCCTSANAVAIVERMFQETSQVVFLPDKHLGAFVASRLGKTKDSLVCYPGFCPTHARITPEDIEAAKKSHPEAQVIAHPECPEAVLELADYIASTEGMCRHIRTSKVNEFIIATEQGVIHRLEKENPDKFFHSPTSAAICPNMKLVNLENIYLSLVEGKYEVDVSPAIAPMARKSIEAMLKI